MSFGDAVRRLEAVLEERARAIPDATPPSLAVFVDCGGSASPLPAAASAAEDAGIGLVLAQAKGFELHDLMHEHVVEEGDGAVMSQQCGCCAAPTVGGEGQEVYMRRPPQACVDARVVIAGDKACGKSTLLANLLGAVSHRATTLVLQQLRFHKACFANLWVDPTAAEVAMMADELGAGPAAHARTLPLMATQLAVGMLHIEASELSFFLQDALPLSDSGGCDNGECSDAFPECADRSLVEEALGRLGLRGAAPPQDAVVRLMELGGDAIDELRAWEANGRADDASPARLGLRRWLLRQLAGEVGACPPLADLGAGGKQQQQSMAARAPNTSICYFVNPSTSFAGGAEGARALVARLAFLVAATASSNSCSAATEDSSPSVTRSIHLFISGAGSGPTSADMAALDGHLKAIASEEAPGATAAANGGGDLHWDERLERLVADAAARLMAIGGEEATTATAAQQRRVIVAVTPRWTQFFSRSPGETYARPDMDAMLAFLRMVLLRHAAVLPRAVVAQATRNAVAEVAAAIGRRPSKELFAEILLNPHHAELNAAAEREAAIVRCRARFDACADAPIASDPLVPVLPLSDITEMLSWLPPMLMVDCFDESLQAA